MRVAVTDLEKVIFRVVFQCGSVYNYNSKKLYTNPSLQYYCS